MAREVRMKKWSTMRQRVDSYLEVRRSMGYCLNIEGDQLHRFAKFADLYGHVGHITLDLAVAWSNNTQKSGQIGRARRLEVVRSLAKYCVTFEPETEIPPSYYLGPAHRRIPPHIYSDGEIHRMMDLASNLFPKKGMRPVTTRCILGLLASTGLRISEALRLTRNDVDLNIGILLIRKTKFRKSRYVPLHQTVCDALSEYAVFRDQSLPIARDSTFFLLDDGNAVKYRQALYAFQLIRDQIDWGAHSLKRKPRLHDLRHTFVCKRLITWYKEGVDVNRSLPLLSTYLGHVKVSDTYWYLTGVPELMKIATARFEQYSQDVLFGGQHG